MADNPLTGKIIAQDRHFRTPIVLDPDMQGPGVSPGSYDAYFMQDATNLFYDALPKSLGIKDYIGMNTNVPRSTTGNAVIDRRDPYSLRIRHELAHVLQAKADEDTGRVGPVWLGRDYNRGINPGGPRNPLSWEFLKSAITGQDPATEHYEKLVNALNGMGLQGPVEAQAFLMGGFEGRDDMPRNPEQEEVLRQRIMRRLRDMGLGEYQKIWREKGR